MATEIRFSTFNASLNRFSEGELITELATPDSAQPQAVAEIIQRVNPDVLLINEFDFDENGEAIASFQQNYLSVSQNGAAPAEYPFVFLAPSNTGIASGFDLNNNGAIVTTPGEAGYGDDALGFGNFPGQFAMVFLSKYPILTDEVRTFQEFLWKDMPGALLPDDPATPEPGDFYSPEELEIFRLSSKSHWDVPILVDGEVVHVLVSHPTPPVFDGAEDRNGTRNHDEIRFWADYVTPGAGSYIYDDNGNFGGLAAGSRFVIMGDQNADPFDGDSTDDAILQLLDNPLINTSVTPASEGGVDASDRQGGANTTHIGDPAFDTADFADTTPGNLRADYVLPSANLEITEAGVFWPTPDEPEFALVGDFPFPSSDHRLVFANVLVEETAEESDRRNVETVEFLGEVQFPTGLLFEDTQVGGLSGLAYDAVNGVYYAIADDRSSINPARFYTLTIDLSDGALADGDVAFTDVTTLLDESGQPFATNSLDPEGIALTNTGTVFISSEGDANALINPFVNEFSLGGQQFAELPVPEKFFPTADQSSGIRNNLAFESLTISPDQRFLYTATENALFQDGPAADVDQESLSRIIQYDLATGQPIKEFFYEVDPVVDEPIPSDQFRTNGLVELLALDNTGTFLALERSFSVGVGNAVRLYEVQAQNTTDVSSLDGLLNPDGSGDLIDVDAIASKRLLLDFGDLGITLDNLEALALGPVLPDGRQSLIVVSDNNFSATQFTQVLAFALDTETTAGIAPVVETPNLIRNTSPESVTDATGDFLSTFSGTPGGDLDVVNAEVVLEGDRLIFSAVLADAVGTTPNALYVFGVDRGNGTEGLVGGTPSVGAGVFFDSVVVLRPDGTGNFNDIIDGTRSVALDPADITISGNRITANIPASILSDVDPNSFTWNLWPRQGTGVNDQISDFAPDASNAPVTTQGDVEADADDPAIYVHPTDPSQSFVIGTLKNAGLAVYDLEGNELQFIAPEGVRYNNVDLVYNFSLGGELVDLAIASDRANDTLAIFAIDPTTRQLTDITAADLSAAEFSIFGTDDGEATAYGLATYTSAVTDASHVFVSQADGDRLAQLSLVDAGDGTVSAAIDRLFTVPTPEGAELEDAQVEGLVVDRELGYLYVGQEGFGIWKYSAEVNGGDTPTLVDTIDEIRNDGNTRLSPDVEGLTIYYGDDGQGYLIASSQGDSTFAIYDRQGSNSYLTSFAVGSGNGIDGAEESDGADIINVPLGDQFPAGLLVVQDGSNEPETVFADPEDGEIQNFNTNFKYVSLADLETGIDNSGVVFESSFDPRDPQVDTLINGVASGDVTQTTAVLWARSTVPGTITFEYSTDPSFSTLEGTITANAATFAAQLSGDQEVPAVESPASGAAQLSLVEDGSGNPVVAYSITVTGVDYGPLFGQAPLTPGTEDDVTLTHIHQADRGVNGPVIFDIPGDDDLTVTFNADGSATLTGVLETSELAGTDGEGLVNALVDGGLYFNIHTNQFPGGELRGQIGLQPNTTTFSSELNGVQEVPAIDSQANGFADLSVGTDEAGNRIVSYSITVTGVDYGPLFGQPSLTPETEDDVILTHIHQGDRGSNGPVVFDIPGDDDLTVTFNDDGSTTLRGILESSELAGIDQEALVNELLDSGLYFNIHTNQFPGGELRGQIIPDVNQPVKVNLSGLEPGTDYYYRATDGAEDQATGQFSTAAEVGTQTGLRFGVSGDWRGELAPYPAISNVVDRDLAFFVEHGDTIYADIESDAVKNPDGTRKAQAETLDEYRAKHSEVYDARFGVNTWEELRASVPVLATIDDHEVTNDFGGGVDVINDPRFTDAPGTLINDSVLYETGLQAFQEYNPIRDDFYGETGDPRFDGERELYRFNTYGSDAAVAVVDTRSFRDEDVTPPANPFDPAQVGAVLAATFEEGRTLLGEVQLNDLKADLLEAQASDITWKFVMVPEPIQNLFPGINTDAYEGYNAERTDLLQFITENAIENVVFVAADVHTTFVNNLTYQEVAFGPQIPTNVFEITTGAVAFDEPTGEFLADIFFGADPATLAFYESLPIAPDTDNEPNDRDDLVEQTINDVLLAPGGYDPLGLDNNLPQAEGLIDATLLQGDYFVGHTYGWTEFDIDPVTQALTVTTYGVEGYSEAEILADVAGISNLEPVIVSQFVVNATGVEVIPEEVELIFGSPADDVFDAGVDPLFDGANDVLFTGEGNDTVDLSATNTDSKIFVGTGEDEIFAGERDRLFGGSGQDTLEGSTGSGGNRLYGGDGPDELIAGSGDRLFGGPGDDIFFLNALGSEGGENRAYGQTGNDVFFLGAGDRVIGDEGDDQFFATTGGLNTLTGSTGADVFFIVNAELPEAENIITDFEAGVDVIGISFAGITSPADLTFSQEGNDALISISGQGVARFLNVDSVALQDGANFVIS